jgi:hypothetical protein
MCAALIGLAAVLPTKHQHSVSCDQSNLTPSSLPPLFRAYKSSATRPVSGRLTASADTCARSRQHRLHCRCTWRSSKAGMSCCPCTTGLGLCFCLRDGLDQPTTPLPRHVVRRLSSQCRVIERTPRVFVCLRAHGLRRPIMHISRCCILIPCVSHAGVGAMHA